MAGGKTCVRAKKQYFFEMQSVVDTHEEPFMVVDKDYCIRSVNTQFEKAYAFSRDALPSKKCYEVTRLLNFPCYDLSGNCPYDSVFRLNKASRHQFEHTLLHGRKRRVDVRGFPLLGADNNVYMGISIYFFAEYELGLSVVTDKLVGQSATFLNLKEKLAIASLSPAPVLLVGEPGSGKHLAATYIHCTSDRRNKPLVNIDCAALSETHFEAEMFGHENMDSTGGASVREGLAAIAHSGTLFIDKISEMPLDMQRKFVHFLKTGEYRRVGGKKTFKSDVRVICSTNCDLSERIDRHSFSKDLYHRISVFTISVPALRLRLDDIPLLVDELLRRIARTTFRVYRVSNEALNLLMTYAYPGNIGELGEIIRLAVTDYSGQVISPADIIKYPHLRSLFDINKRGAANSEYAAFSTKRILEDAEERHIRGMLNKHVSRSKAALALGMSERTLYRKMAHYGIR